MAVEDSWQEWHHLWYAILENFIQEQNLTPDGAHDFSHLRRVVANCKILCHFEGGEPWVVLPAAWLHDHVAIPKKLPDRSQASQLAGISAVAFLKKVGYPIQYLTAIEHAIVAHSFSAGISPKTCEAKIVQDADRLDALGAIGIARCFLTAGLMGSRIYDVDDPFCRHRCWNDHAFAVDHFFKKLLKLPHQMQTKTGTKLATERARFVTQFLHQLGLEIGTDQQEILAACLPSGERDP